MHQDAAGLREVMVVLVVALVGLLLAATVAFAPWDVGAAPPPVVRMESPSVPASAG